MSNILVTGSAGFVGQHLMKKLAESEHNITGYDLKNGHDIRYLTSTLLLNYDVVIHLAANPSVSESIASPVSSFENNVYGTLVVIEACRRSGAKLVFASSSQATGDALNPYGLQKRQCEDLIKLYGNLYGLRYAIHRIYNIFGEGGHGVIESFLKAKTENKQLKINGGQQKRDFIWVGTVVDRLIESIDEEGVFELGSGDWISVQDIADLISPNQVKLPYPDGEPLVTLSPVATPTKSVGEYLKEQLNK